MKNENRGISPLLTVRGLSKTYPNGTRALNNINLEVNAGEFLVIIGLSGSGKSTLLRCLNRLIDPSAGEIIFNGQNIEKLRGSQLSRLRQKMAMIFQSFNLVPRLSVMTNVLTGRLAYVSFWKSLFGMFRPSDRDLALKNLKLVGLEDKASARADHLSGGQQQRVAIARALSQEPQLLLADEPVASLDPAMSHTVMDYLKRANQERGITVICNLHFLSLVREYGTRVVALRNGEIVFQGRPEEITDQWFKQIYGESARDVHVR